MLVDLFEVVPDFFGKQVGHLFDHFVQHFLQIASNDLIVVSFRDLKFRAKLCHADHSQLIRIQQALAALLRLFLRIPFQQTLRIPSRFPEILPAFATGLPGQIAANAGVTSPRVFIGLLAQICQALFSMTIYILTQGAVQMIIIANK